MDAPNSVPLEEGAIVGAVTEYYLKSRDFNGFPVRLVAGADGDRHSLLTGLIERRVVSVNVGDRHPNPHIQAFAPEPPEKQIRSLAAASIDHACLYPTKEHLAGVVDATSYAGQPYTLELALGEPQIVCRFFELKVLEHYRNDPRYSYRTNDVQGSLSIRGEFYETGKVKESDQILMQQFGFGYDEDVTTRVVAALLWDLSGLSDEHQQIWKANELSGRYLPHPDFWRAVLGHWPERISIFEAFIEELRQINQMSRLMGRAPLFRKDFSGVDKPREFGFLIRPTLAEFNAFVQLLDKLLSDNIDPAFFGGDVLMETLEPRADGALVVKPKGTISALSEWLDQKWQTPDPAPQVRMLKAFRTVRKLRSKPAHAIKKRQLSESLALSVLSACP